MKKRTLNQTWVLCLRMWRSISKKWTGRISVHILKARWLKANGFPPNTIEEDCFFCDYTNGVDAGCSQCPGCLVDPNFRCSGNDYDYEDKPVAFYAGLLRLNQIRKAKKDVK